MLKLDWKVEINRGRLASLSLPIQLTRTKASAITNVTSWGLRISTIQQIIKALKIKMPFGVRPNDWGKHITIDNIYEYLERGCRYGSDNFEAFREVIIIGSELGWVPDMCIGTELNDKRFAAFGVCYAEDLKGLIYVWEKYNRYPELIPVAKDILIKLNLN